MRQNEAVAPADPSAVSRHRVRSGYGLLLVAIAISYTLSLLSTISPLAYSALIFVQLLTVWLALRVSEAAKLTRIAGIALVVVALGVLGALLFGSEGEAAGLASINEWAFLISTLLYLFAPVVIVRHILGRSGVDLESLLGVISAYLMIGMAFAFVYRLLGDVQDGDFFGAAGDGSLADDLFFSFTTMTTVGYGNLVPAGNPGQTLAMLEAMIGQLFMVIVVAKVVTGLRRGPSGTGTPGGSNPGDEPAA